MKTVNVDYIAQAKKLTGDDRERVLSRMGGKLPKRLQKEKLSADEAIAIQLELEDEQLQEWRKHMAEIQEKSAKAKLKADEKAAKASKKADVKVASAKQLVEAKPAAKPAVVKDDVKSADVATKSPVAK